MKRTFYKLITLARPLLCSALLAFLAWTLFTPSQATPTLAAATPAPPVITQTVTAQRNANLRAGPGTTYKVIGSVKPGQQLTVTSQTPAGDWLQLHTGAWIATFLVKPAGSAPAPAAATPTPTTAAQPSAASTATPVPPPTAAQPAEPAAANVSLLILINAGKQEILAIRNNASTPVSISGWWLNGSKGDETCTIPNGIAVEPGASYQIATGDSTPTGPGYSCADKPIWNNGGETIYLHMHDGQTLSIESARVE